MAGWLLLRALLMPKRGIERLVRGFGEGGNVAETPIAVNTLEALQLVTAVVKGFSVSRKAATVRLFQLGHLQEGSAGGEKI